MLWAGIYGHPSDCVGRKHYFERHLKIVTLACISALEYARKLCRGHVAILMSYL